MSSYTREDDGQFLAFYMGTEEGLAYGLLIMVTVSPDEIL